MKRETREGQASLAVKSLEEGWKNAMYAKMYAARSSKSSQKRVALQEVP